MEVSFLSFFFFFPFSKMDVDHRLFVSLYARVTTVVSPSVSLLVLSEQWEVASEQVQPRDQEGLPAARTKPVLR